MSINFENILKSIPFWKNYKLRWLEVTTSTNDDLKAIWRNSDFCHTIEVTDIQTNGKGQYGRKWESDLIGQCLMFSFSVDTKEYKFPISMIAGVALASALDKLGVNNKDFWLKWPNDVWIKDKKLAGILTESTTFAGGFRSIVGIGINILPLTNKAVNSISLGEYGIDTNRENVLAEFCRAWSDIFLLEDTKQSELWEKYSYLFWNHKIKVQIPNEQAFIAKPLSLNADGSLIVTTSGGEKRKIISATIMPII